MIMDEAAFPGSERAKRTLLCGDAMDNSIPSSPDITHLIILAIDSADS